MLHNSGALLNHTLPKEKKKNHSANLHSMLLLLLACTAPHPASPATGVLTYYWASLMQTAFNYNSSGRRVSNAFVPPDAVLYSPPQKKIKNTSKLTSAQLITQCQALVPVIVLFWFWCTDEDWSFVWAPHLHLSLCFSSSCWAFEHI